MKIILPVAGKGERMRPYTNNLPKCLLPVGGKTIIDWIIGDTAALTPTETIFITGYKAEVMDTFLKNRPNWGATRTVLQSDPQGLGQAISLALPHVSDSEPVLIILGDTLFDADIGALAHAKENVLYTYKVQDPRRFGVAVTDKSGNIERLVEKPQEFVSDEAIVGIYYIKDVKELKAALKHLISNNIRTKGEFQLTDALQMMIEKGCKFSTAPVREWLDCGLPQTLIQTNTWLLQNRQPQSHAEPAASNAEQTASHAELVSASTFPTSTIIQPCVIGKNTVIENCTIGPNVAIGDNCTLKKVCMKNCVVWDNEKLSYTIADGQIIASGV